MFNAAALQVLGQIDNDNLNRVNPERVFRDRLDPLNVPDHHLLRYYRFPRHSIIELCALLEPFLIRPTARSHSIPVPTQVLAALRFFASGSMQSVIGDVTGISQSSCSRIMRDVTDALTILSPNYITYPLDDPAYIAQVKTEFHNIAEFPGIIGIIDGTLINIKAPVEDEPAFVDRYRNHSVNCQIVCGPNQRIVNMVARWPGSAHDQFILSQSALKQRLDNGVVPSGWLLGDGGYGVDVHLLIPFLNPATPGQKKYNKSLKKTRCLVERCIGVLKSRFRCIDTSGGSLQYKPLRCAKIIVSCTVLHNLCIERRIPLVDDGQQNHVPPAHNNNLNLIHVGDPNAIDLRRRLIAAYFD